MKKIPSRFQRNYDGDRQVRDEAVPGSEWVLAGEGIATVKWDGTACMVRDGALFKRYDRKKNKKGNMKPAPDGWEACEPEPNEHTGHWPGWVPVGDGSEDKHLRAVDVTHLSDGTYELVGPKFQGNPHKYKQSTLIRHGNHQLVVTLCTFEKIQTYLADDQSIEGIVWHHPDGRMVKIKRRDFGLVWPQQIKVKE